MTMPSSSHSDTADDKDGAHTYIMTARISDNVNDNGDHLHCDDKLNIVMGGEIMAARAIKLIPINKLHTWTMI